MPHESSLDSKLVTLEDMKALIYGGCFLASGGGGPISMGLMFHQKIQRDVPLLTAAELTKGKMAAMIADLGSPDKAKEGYGYTAPVNAFHALDAYLEKTKGESLSYFIPAEIGAVNTLIPFYIAATVTDKALAVVNGDSVGRAVPQLNETVFANNGIPCCPAVVASDDQTAHCCEFSGKPFKSKLFKDLSPTELENAARDVVSDPAYHQVGGMGLWPVSSDFLQSSAGTAALIQNSVSDAIRLGRTILSYLGDQAISDTLTNLGIDNYQFMTGTLTQMDNRTSGGFDVGKMTFTREDNSEFWVYYKNESLLAWDPAESRPMAIAPDCINMVLAKSTDDYQAGTPLSTADVIQGNTLTVWGTACSKKMRVDRLEALFLRDIHQILSAFPEDKVTITQYIPIEVLNN